MAYFDVVNLLPTLRLYLGEKDPATYRYTDAWLISSLLCAVEAIGPRWNYRYLVDDASLLVYRNTAIDDFIFPEPPVIQKGDNFPIILQAAIIVKEGSLESMSWNFSSWRDAEISYSNLESSRAKDASLARDITMLDTMLPWRAKRLAQPRKGHLPGYKYNPYEHD